MDQVVLKYSPGMRRLLDGGWATGLCAEVGKEVLKATVGGSGMARRHHAQRQGSWPALAKSTLKDKRKTDKRKFVSTGNVLRAISAPASNGKLLAWGGSADMYASGQRSFRYTANGIHASARINNAGLHVTIGFNGKLKHSTPFNRTRKTLAAGKGVDVRGRGGAKRIRQAVTVRETYAALKKAGKPFRKFEAMGALGIEVGGKRPKMVKARGRDNLAYADIVQAGPFAGIRKNSTGRLFTPHEVPKAIASGKIDKNDTIVRGKRPRQLLPYDTGDAGLLQSAVDRGVVRIFRHLERT